MARAFPILLTCALLALAVVARTQTPPQLPARTTASDKLFEKIYPVFASPRCSNCHGVVQHYPGFTHSVTPDTHPGGAAGAGLPDPVVDCTDCHDATEDKWQVTAPPNMEWAGLPEEQVCVMEAAEVRLKNHEAGGDSAARKGSYLNHLSTDLLIQSAWLGRAGGARPKVDEHNQPVLPLPAPPLPYPEFVAAAGEWVNAGAPCRATGHISHVEEQDTAIATEMFGMKISFTQSAKRSVNILRNRDGSATATVTAAGWYETVSRMNLGNCEMVTDIRNAWSRTGPSQSSAKVDVTVEPNEYTIDVALPEETTHTVTTTKATNTCGIPMPATPPEDIDLTWPSWTMTLHCPTVFPDGDGTMGCLPSEPHDTGATDGALHQTVKGASDAADPRSWLIGSPMAVGAPDGSSVPVHVKIIWSLVLTQK
jgi:hypothetical protein